MPQATLQNPPKLQPPGAGLPKLQLFMAKHFVFPSFCRKTSWDEAQRLFDREGEKILKLARGMDPAKLGQPVLVSGIRGIEDSSRFWSVAMAMEHLIIVGSRMGKVIVDLTHGIRPSGTANTADVKPLGKGDPPQVVSDYEKFLPEFRATSLQKAGDRHSKTTYAHPWFGEITAHQWQCLAAAHQNIHRKQIEAILRGLEQIS